MREHIDTATVQADFDRIALLSNKDADEGWSHNNHYHRFLLKQVPARCAEALDIGCGTGEFARLLASRAEHVLALDLSPQMIKLARERSTGSATIDFEAADALSWTFSPEQFDSIVSIAALHHMPMEAIIPKMKEALAKGGTLVVLDICEARFSDLFVNLAAIPANLFMQRVKNGHRPAASAEARAAMEEHIAHDSYLTLSKVHKMCQPLLQGEGVKRNLFCGYSIAWTRPK